MRYLPLINGKAAEGFTDGEEAMIPIRRGDGKHTGWLKVIWSAPLQKWMTIPEKEEENKP
jgi:hypothetical protein